MEKIVTPENVLKYQQTTRPKRDWKEYASIAALGFAVITAALSYLGRIYYQGYNGFWGLPVEMFSLSKEQSVLGGVIAYILVFVNVLLDWMLVLVLIISGLIFLAMLSCLRVVKDRLESFSRKLIDLLRPWVSKHADFSDRIDRIIDRLYLFLLGIAALVTIVFITIQGYKWASDEGKKIAHKNYDAILSGKPSIQPFPSRATLLITNPSKGFDTYSGHLIQTSATHCALYQKGRGVIIFPLASIARMEIAENNAGANRSMDGKK